MDSFDKIKILSFVITYNEKQKRKEKRKVD